MVKLDDFLEREKYQNFKYYLHQNTVVGSKLEEDD